MSASCSTHASGAAHSCQLSHTLAPRCHALIPAAGSGSRMQSACPKQYLPLAGQALILHALQTFAALACIERIYVVLSAEDDYWQEDWTRDLAPKLKVLRCGGASRAESVRNGLQAMHVDVAASDWVLVHDAARPCLSKASVENLINTVTTGHAVGGLLALPVADTLKRADASQLIQTTVSRENLWQAQTPQMFRHGDLLQALLACTDLTQLTDEASAIEAQGGQPLLVASTLSNFKVTYPDDLQLAAWIVQQQKENA